MNDDTLFTSSILAEVCELEAIHKCVDEEKTPKVKMKILNESLNDHLNLSRKNVASNSKIEIKELQSFFNKSESSSNGKDTVSFRKDSFDEIFAQQMFSFEEVNKSKTTQPIDESSSLKKNKKITKSKLFGQDRDVEIINTTIEDYKSVKLKNIPFEKTKSNINNASFDESFTENSFIENGNSNFIFHNENPYKVDTTQEKTFRKKDNSKIIKLFNDEEDTSFRKPSTSKIFKNLNRMNLKENIKHDSQQNVKVKYGSNNCTKDVTKLHKLEKYDEHCMLDKSNEDNNVNNCVDLSNLNNSNNRSNLKNSDDHNSLNNCTELSNLSKCNEDNYLNHSNGDNDMINSKEHISLNNSNGHLDNSNMLNENTSTHLPNSNLRQSLNVNSNTTNTKSEISSFLNTQDKLNLSSWGLPDGVLQKYQEYGITTMFSWQVECLSLPGVLQGSNLVFSAPTSAGKTLVAELLLLKRVMEVKKKAIFILPFVSIAREKTQSLQKLFGNTGIRVEGFMGGCAPPGGFKNVDIAICTMEKANNIINKLIQENNLDLLCAVVVDELHLVGDRNRGYLLELLLTKLRYVSRSYITDSDNSNIIQIVGMSATLPNLDLVANWLDAQLYCTNFRPIPLQEMLKIGNKIYDSELNEIRTLNSELEVKNDQDHLVQICLETILENNFSVLIFCPTKAWCEKLSTTIASHLFEIGKPNSIYPSVISNKLRERLDATALSRVLDALRNCPAGLDSTLRKSISFGVAFHHAGLTHDERDIIEGAFRASYLPILIATSTLSSGVNLPSRRVIIRSPTFGGSILDTMTYKQMIGRAGRLGYDTHGESILFCTDNDKHKGKVLVKSTLPAIKSCLQIDSSLTSSMKRAILEIVVSGAAMTSSDIDRYCKSTLLATSLLNESDSEQKSMISQCLEFLIGNEFVREQSFEDETKFIGTQLGKAVLSSSLSPDEGLQVFSELHRARRCFVLENELHIIYQITPIYVSKMWPNSDWVTFLNIWEELSVDLRYVGNLIGVQESFLIRAVKGIINTRVPHQMKQLAIHQRFFCALALHELVQEVPIHSVSEKFGVNKGLLQSLQQNAATFSGMVTIFCHCLGWFNLELLISQFQNRLHFGIRRELCDLIRLDNLNAGLARLIFNAGLETVKMIAHSTPQIIENILITGTPFRSTKIAKSPNTGILFSTSGKPLTEKELSLLVVEEARSLTEKELGLSNICWDQKPSSVIEMNKSSKNQLNTQTLKDCNYTSMTQMNSSAIEKINKTNNICLNEGNVILSSNLQNVKPCTSKSQMDKTILKDKHGKVSGNTRKSVEENCTNQSSSDKPTNQSSFDKPSNQFSSDKPTNQSSFNKPTNKLTNQSSLDKLTNQSSSNKPINKSSLDKPTNQSSLDKPTNQSSSNKPSNQSSLDKHTNQSSLDKHTNQSSLDKPTNQSSSNKPSNQSSLDKHTNQSSLDKPINQSSLDKPITRSKKNKENIRDCLFGFVKKTEEIDQKKVFNDNESNNSKIKKRKSTVLSPPKMKQTKKKKDEEDVLLNVPKVVSCAISKTDKTDEFDIMEKNDENVFGSKENVLMNSKEENKISINTNVYCKLTSLKAKEKSSTKNEISNCNIANVEENTFISKKLDQGIQNSLENNKLQSNETLMVKRKKISSDSMFDLANDLQNCSQEQDIFGDTFMDITPRTEALLMDENNINVKSSTLKEDDIQSEIIENTNNDPNKTNKRPKNRMSDDIFSSYPLNSDEEENYSNEDPNIQMVKQNSSLNEKSEQSNLKKFTKNLLFKSSDKIKQSVAKPDEDKNKLTFVVDCLKECKSSANKVDIQSSEEKSSEFCIIDVASNVELFKTFISEWKLKKYFALSLSCEEAPKSTTIGGIGWKIFSKASRPKRNSQIKQVVGITIENTSLLVVGISICWEKSDVYYINLKSIQNESISCSLPTPPLTNDIPLEERISAIKDVLLNSQIKNRNISMWDVKTNLSIILKAGFGLVYGSLQDPQVANWLLDPSAKVKNIQNLTMTYAPHLMKILDKIGSTWGLKSLGISTKNVGSSRVLAATEAAIVFHITPILSDLLKNEGLYELWQKIEIPSIISLTYMEISGIGFNLKECETQKQIILSKLDSLVQEAHMLAGEKFSLSSPTDVSKILYKTLHLSFENKKLTQRSRISGPINKEALEKLSSQHRLPQIILEWRRLTFALNKIICPLQQAKIYSPLQAMYRIHSSCQVFTATGRISMHEPNLQTVPRDFEIKISNMTKSSSSKLMSNSQIMKQLAPLLNNLENEHEKKVSLRHAFLAGKDRVLIAADYSQLELRILAHFSRDKRLIKFLNSEEDFFITIGALLNKISIQDVSSQQRQEAKQICYGIIYGIGEGSLSHQLNMSEEHAADFMKIFLESFPSVQNFIKKTKLEAHRNGYVRTIYGRKRYLADLQSDDISSKHKSERQAVNSVIQGSAADIAKLAMVKIEEAMRVAFPNSPSCLGVSLNKNKLLRGGFLVLHLHDELIYEVVSEDVIQVCQIIKQNMENVKKLLVRLPVKVNVGQSWGSMQSIGV